MFSIIGYGGIWLSPDPLVLRHKFDKIIIQALKIEIP